MVCCLVVGSVLCVALCVSRGRGGLLGARGFGYSWTIRPVPRGNRGEGAEDK